MQYANIEKVPSRSTRHKNKSVKKPGKAKRVIFFAGLFFLVFGVYYFLPAILELTKVFVKSPKTIYQVVANKEPELKNYNGRSNILILGTGGGDHDGPDLTDTIIVASVDIKTGDSVLISLPRDVYISEKQSKINAVYASAKPKDEALEQTKEVIGKKLGIPVHYGVRVNFDGFTKAIDTVGGIDVEVVTPFDDYAYPRKGAEYDTCGYTEGYDQVEVPVTVPQQATASANEDNQSPLPSASSNAGMKTVRRPYYVNASTGKKIYADEVSDKNNPYACRYEHIRFVKGKTQMSGTTALKFVRSRKGTNGEGSDFARSRRQQAVITAFRQKVVSQETLFDVSKISGLVSAFGQSLDTDITPSMYGDFYVLYKRMKEKPIRTLALTDGSDDESGVFINPPTTEYGGSWVLIPPRNDWSVIQEKVANVQIEPTPTPSPSSSLSPSPSARLPRNP